MKTFTSLTVCCLSIIAGAWVAGTGAAGFVEKSILVTVLDKDDVPIRDLTAADFTVREDGKAREVTDASLATDRLYVSVLIDTAKPPPGDVDRIRDMRTALTTFVKATHGASPTPEIAIMTTGGAGVLVKDFTRQLADLEQVTTRLVPDLPSHSVMLEALIDASRGFANKTSPRRAIVTVDFASKENSEVQPTKVIEAVLQAGASVWCVSVQGSQGLTAPRRDTTLNFLTKNTGGVRSTALLPSALEVMMKKVADSLNAQYVVTYIRPDGTQPKAIVPSARRGSKFLISPYVQ